MIQIDGSQGEGGGQMIRSSLALAAVTGQAVRIVNVRANRRKPGLMRQHLTALQAAGKICNAQIAGAELGAREISFEPDSIRGGFFEFSVGTAGSTTLVAQTVLPALMMADESSSVVIEGGTHNPFAPPVDFLQHSFLPILNRIGPSVSVEIDSYGFYPAGGGRIRVSIQPAKQLQGLELLDRGKKAGPEKVTAVVSNLPRSVAERECETIRRKTQWQPDQFHIHEVKEPRGPGNLVSIEMQFENVTAHFTGFGKVGVKAEQVARSVVRDARSYLKTDAPVGPYLADQIMLPLALAAHRGQPSTFRTSNLTQHSLTHIEILQTFLGIRFDVQPDDDGTNRVRIG